MLGTGYMSYGEPAAYLLVEPPLNSLSCTISPSRQFGTESLEDHSGLYVIWNARVAGLGAA